MSVKFCHVLCHKCTWYFLATSQSSKSTCTQCLYISCHEYFNVRLILNELGVSLPYENGFKKFKNSYIKSMYYSICDNYGVDENEIWMYGD